MVFTAMFLYKDHYIYYNPKGNQFIVKMPFCDSDAIWGYLGCLFFSELYLLRIDIYVNQYVKGVLLWQKRKTPVLRWKFIDFAVSSYLLEAVFCQSHSQDHRFQNFLFQSLLLHRLSSCRPGHHRPSSDSVWSLPADR